MISGSVGRVTPLGAQEDVPMPMTGTIRQDDFIRSVADALQHYVIAVGDAA